MKEKVKIYIVLKSGDRVFLHDPCDVDKTELGIIKETKIIPDKLWSFVLSFYNDQSKKSAKPIKITDVLVIYYNNGEEQTITCDMLDYFKNNEE